MLTAACAGRDATWRHLALIDILSSAVVGGSYLSKGVWPRNSSRIREKGQAYPTRGRPSHEGVAPGVSCRCPQTRQTPYSVPCRDGTFSQHATRFHNCNRSASACRWVDRSCRASWHLRDLRAVGQAPPEVLANTVEQSKNQAIAEHACPLG